MGEALDEGPDDAAVECSVEVVRSALEIEIAEFQGLLGRLDLQIDASLAPLL